MIGHYLNMYKEIQKIWVQSNGSELVKLKWDLHSPVVHKHFEKISSYNLFQILTQTSDF